MKFPVLGGPIRSRPEQLVMDLDVDASAAVKEVNALLDTDSCQEVHEVLGGSLHCPLDLRRGHDILAVRSPDAVYVDAQGVGQAVLQSSYRVLRSVLVLVPGLADVFYNWLQRSSVA